jgi:hypothetical protein
MSKVLYACLRRPSHAETGELKRRIAAGAHRIQPSGVDVRPPRLISRDRVVAGISSPSATNLVHGASVAVGCMERTPRWHIPGTPAPEGTYAICRSDERRIEVLTDAVASRTLWYYVDDSIFLASTSQRWLACVLGHFVPNERALTWMLVSGSLGPADSWDARFSRLPPDSTLSLDLDRWTVHLSRADDTFVPSTASSAEQREHLRGVLRETFDALDFDYSSWVLPLSGGYDSRGILCTLRRDRSLRTITWGTRASMHNPASDAAIARRLAESLGVTHEYLHTDLISGSLGDVLDQFVANGEGRTDHISGYLDGFAIWKMLTHRGVEGVIRGDEGFGWNRVPTTEQARKSVGLLLWSDFGNLPDLDELGFAPQELPEHLLLRKGETASQWRDRLYHGFRIPTILAALTDLKAPFVEIANPLLTHSIVRLVRRMPDRMRTEKRLFREVVDDIGPGIPYAREAAIADVKTVLRGREAVEILSDTVRSEAARALLPPALLEHIGAHIASALPAGGRRRGFRRRVLDGIPPPVRAALRRFRRQHPMDFNAMALRVCIICMTHRLLEADAATATTKPVRKLLLQ